LSGWLFRSYEGVYHDKEVVIALPFPGSPAAVAALEVLTVMDGEAFVAVGLVGAISPALKNGDGLIPTWRIREEGANFHYMPANTYVPKPDGKLIETPYTYAIRLKGRRIKVVKGSV
jgi:uridine phosphorylase